MKLKKKIPYHDKYTAIKKFNELTAENFAASLKQAKRATMIFLTL